MRPNKALPLPVRMGFILLVIKSIAHFAKLQGLTYTIRLHCVIWRELI